MSSSTAPATTGATTAPAAPAATTQGPPPTVAAPATAQPANTAPRPANPGRSFAARKPIDGASATSNAGLSQMLSAVSELPLSSVNRNIVTRVVPSTWMLFYVVHLMDTQMVQTKRFTDANAAWMPFVSQLYFSILVYYQVLVNQRVGSYISRIQMQFLEFLEENFNIKHAKIPGPVVPFFQALAANGGINSDFGNYVYHIPNEMQVRQNNHFATTNRLERLLPMPIFILDQFIRYLVNIAPPAAAAIPPATLAMTDMFYLNFFGHNAANNDVRRFWIRTPTAIHGVPMMLPNVTNLQNTANVWYSVLPMDPATNQSTYLDGAGAANLDFDQVLGFRGHGNTSNTIFGWFETVGRLMQPYSDYFRDSVSLGAISTIGTGIIYVETRLAATAANAAIYTGEVTVRPQRYVQQNAPDRYNSYPFHVQNTASFDHPLEKLDIVSEQQGVLTQLNVVAAPLNAHANSVYDFPVAANYREGPILAFPEFRARPDTQVANKLSNVITGYYHSASALNFN